MLAILLYIPFLIGSTIFIEVAGDDCCLLSREALDGLQLATTTGNIYVSSSPGRGATDIEAFNKYIETNVGM